MNIKPIFLITFLCLYLGCDREQPVLYLSEPLPFPADSTGREEIFFTSDFNPEEIPSPLNPENLGQVSDLQWQQIPKNKEIDFLQHTESGQNTWHSIYVIDEIISEEDQKAVLSVGSDDGFALWVNGRFTGGRYIGRAVEPDSDWLPVDLKKGLNQLLFKVEQREEGWGLWYEFASSERVKTILKNRPHIVYRDLPAAAIIENHSQVLPLKPDPRHRFDSLHTMHLQWKREDGTSLQDTLLFDGYNLPDTIPLPALNRDVFLFQYEVTRENGESVYSETIPIFTEKSFETAVRKIKEQPKRDSSAEAFLKISNSNSYSTRMKAEWAADLMKELNLTSGPRMKVHAANREAGRSQEKNVFRFYLPPAHTKRGVIAMHTEFSESVNSYSQTYAGRSHARMVHWNSLAARYGLCIAVPYLKQAGEVSNFMENMNHVSDLIRGQCGDNQQAVIAWSKSVLTLFQWLEKEKRPVHTAALVSPWLNDNVIDRIQIIQKLAETNPQITWHIWHGLDDIDVPVYIPRRWVEAMRNAGMDVHFYEQEGATHWNYKEDPEESLYKLLTNHSSDD
ncbi:MAG TPA: hypothetical protein VKM36_09330 [Balneolaceae bacterium]|nr:hypothetical protein [Balneolaceae bacterium]